MPYYLLYGITDSRFIIGLAVNKKRLSQIKHSFLLDYAEDLLQERGDPHVLLDYKAAKRNRKGSFSRLALSTEVQFDVVEYSSVEKLVRIDLDRKRFFDPVGKSAVMAQLKEISSF